MAKFLSFVEATCDKKTSRYMAKTHACANNCADKTAVRKCKYEKTEDCACKRGYILSGDECVKGKGKNTPNCGCEQKGRYFKVFKLRFSTLLLATFHVGFC